MLQGTKTFVLANEDGQIELTHSVSAGLDYAAVGPDTVTCATRNGSNTITRPTMKRSPRSEPWPNGRNHPRARNRARDRSCD